MKLNYHRNMVRKALRRAGFGPRCIDCAVEGNEGQDTTVATDPGQTHSEYHFDGCDFHGGIAYVASQWAEIDRLIAADCAANRCDILRAWGKISHAYQDFYAHSNWVELGHEAVWDGQSVPADLISGRWILEGFVCRDETKACPTHGVLLHDDDDLSKDEPDRRRFDRALRLAIRHTRQLAGELARRMGPACMAGCH